MPLSMLARSALLLPVLAALAGTGAAHAQGQKIVINQSAQSLSAAAIYIAKDAGFFAAEGLNVEFIATGSGIKSIVPLVRGDTQFCACIFSHPVDAQTSGAGDVKIIGTVVNGYNHKIVIRKDIAEKMGLTPATPLETRIKALKGLKIGITEPNASTDQVVRLAMEQFGLDPNKDAQLIALGANNLPPAIQNKQIDSFVMVPPIPERAVQAGDAVYLMDLAKDSLPLLRDSIYMTIAVEPAYLAKNRATAVKLMRAISKAQVMLTEKQADARKLLKDKQFPQMDQDTFDIGFNSLIPFYLKSPEASRESVEAGLALAKKFSRTPITLTYDTLVDPTVVKEALAQ